MIEIENEEDLKLYLENNASYVLDLLVNQFKEKAAKNKGWPYGDYYQALTQQATMMYLALRGLDEM